MLGSIFGEKRNTMKPNTPVEGPYLDWAMFPTQVRQFIAGHRPPAAARPPHAHICTHIYIMRGGWSGLTPSHATTKLSAGGSWKPNSFYSPTRFSFTSSLNVIRFAIVTPPRDFKWGLKKQLYFHGIITTTTNFRGRNGQLVIFGPNFFVCTPPPPTSKVTKGSDS